MNYKNLDIKWLGHAGFKIEADETIIYIDPFKLIKDESELDKADFIFITHSHYDHCSIEDIQKIAKNGTIIVCTADCQSKFRHIYQKIDLKVVSPGTRMEFEENNIKFWAVPSYTPNKETHPNEEDWVGYIIQLGDVSIYHAGDTDLIPEMSQLKSTGIDIALLPIGGTYTMNAGEAAKAACLIKPKLAIPMHYATNISGLAGKGDAEVFTKLCSSEGIDCKILGVEN